ncbi:Rv2732c family membrane protein [Corynebacterium doosanense]|uniref:Uncharacterized protein n=1 Tax=Corynebacterium doosanense CAU 212 = DSM 45436 TaxID=558173 RepID=A0A097IGS0_9CORY|nr:hypothetical protein [Corynebacterium doosanense]AIT61297.1 hypothetical protein CDOO_08530 [Corynebacterium doosanense CAU 212 = DSM 45436]
MTSPHSNNLAGAEKHAARRMSLDGQQWTLIAAVIIWLAYLVLPHAGGVSGFEVTFARPAAAEAGIKITEYVYAILIGLGIGVLTTLTLITRRAVFGLTAWMLVTVGLFYAVFALWLRQTRSSADDGVNMGVGMYLSILGVLLAVVAYSMVALRRDPEQSHIAEERARREELDEVGLTQRAVMEQERRSMEGNPLLIDDRRRRAAQRHRPED